MWFSKWLRRRDKEQDYEPAAHPPVNSATRLPGQTPAGSARPDIQAAEARTSKTNQAESASNEAAKTYGFDPYNSGAFKRHNAWERVNRR